jgi:hypothetical protein
MLLPRLLYLSILQHFLPASTLHLHYRHTSHLYHGSFTHLSCFRQACLFLAFTCFPMAFSVHVWLKSTFWMIVTNIMSEHVVYNSEAVCLHATQF